MIFLANKPINISSNTYVSKLGKKLKLKLGYSGTLDPFASGALLCACKKHTKLFRFLNVEPKIYEATIWLGAKSASLDNENVVLTNASIFNEDDIKSAFSKFQGEIKYIPPIFCAKKVNGVRAYDLARAGKQVELNECVMNVKATFLHYKHPFISFRLEASKGTYVRSYAQMICEYLQVDGTLSSLRRVSEGNFCEFKEYDAFLSVDLEENYYLANKDDILLGKKLKKDLFANRNNGIYKVDLGEYFSILQIDDEVSYILNKVEKC